MRHFIIGAIVVACLSIFCLWCSDSPNVAKDIGGTSTVTLPPKTKVVLVTWKNNSMWMLTRPFRAGDKAEEYTYQELSTLGIIEARIKIKECE